MPTSVLPFSLALGLSLAVATAPPARSEAGLAPFADADINALVTLPSTGLKALQLTDGRMVLMTAEGRYVITGRVFDTRLGRELLGFDDLRASIDTVGADLVRALDVEAMAPFRFGRGAERLLVFVDPLCDACHRLVGELRALEPEATVLLLPVPSTDRSNETVIQLHCARDPERAAEVLLTAADPADLVRRAGALPQLEQAVCDSAPLFHRLTAAHLLDVRQVPFLIAADGRISRGAPPDLRSFVSGG